LEGPELAAEDTRLERAFVLLVMGQTMSSHSDDEQARQLFEQSLALYRAVGEDWWTAHLLNALGGIALKLGAYEKAKQLTEESLAIRRTLGDPTKVADSLVSLSFIALSRRQLEDAGRLLQESVALYREAGGRGDIALGFMRIGRAFLWLGRLDEAHSLLEESLTIFSDLGNRGSLARTNIWLGYTKMHVGQYEQARAQGQMGLAFAQEVRHQWRRGAGHALFVLGSVALVEGACTEAWQLLEESCAVYRETGSRDRLGRALATLGYAARGLGQLPQAKQHLSEVLRATAETGAFRSLLLALPVMALLLADQGEVERAVEIYALASRYPLVANSRWFDDVAGKHIAKVAASLPPEVVVAAQERGRARDLDATVAELLDELEFWDTRLQLPV
jgi:tetratricopeptide (TPR) repeat protein